jgi:hypothetical protein
MEKAFDSYLTDYWKMVKKWGTMRIWGKEIKVYGRYEGDLFRRRMMDGYRWSNRLPDRQEDIEALGGIEMFK